MVLAGEAGLSGIPLFEPNLKRETAMFDLQSLTSALHGGHSQFFGHQV